MIDYEKQGAWLKALAHPVRLRMVSGLSCNECHVDKMVQKLKLPQSTISQHLAVLKKEGILEARKEGVKTCYKVVDEKVVALLKVLSA